MNSAHANIIKKANALFQSASYINHIKSNTEYQKSLDLMDELFKDYEHNRSLIEVLSNAIEKWENEANEFTLFNQHIDEVDTAEALLQVLMEQYKLGTADLPEIGSKSLVSKILNNERRLTRNHIAVLAKRFNISPALFY